MDRITFFPGFATTNDIWSDFSLKSDHKCAIAWSMGCFDAIHQHKNYQKLVLVSGTPKFISDETFPQGIPKALFRNLERKIEADLDAGLEFFYNMVEPRLGEQVPKFKKDEILTQLNKLKMEDVRKLLHEIDIPILLIHGDQDPICKVEASKYMAEAIPGSRLVVFEGVGHAPFLEESEKFNRIVQEFIS